MTPMSRWARRCIRRCYTRTAESFMRGRGGLRYPERPVFRGGHEDLCGLHQIFHGLQGSGSRRISQPVPHRRCRWASMPPPCTTRWNFSPLEIRGLWSMHGIRAFRMGTAAWTTKTSPRPTTPSSWPTVPIKDAAWDFVRWWQSTDVQYDYAMQLEAVFGVSRPVCPRQQRGAGPAALSEESAGCCWRSMRIRLESRRSLGPI